MAAIAGLELVNMPRRVSLLVTIPVIAWYVYLNCRSLRAAASTVAALYKGFYDNQTYLFFRKAKDSSPPGPEISGQDVLQA